MNHEPCTIESWWHAPPDADVRAALGRLASLPDVCRVAVMPDVHLADEVCIGVALATRSTLYPAAVGSDIGCGMATIDLGVEASALRRADVAAGVLDAFTRRIPIQRHTRKHAPVLPSALRSAEVGSPQLEAAKRGDALLQFATLGRGNHFLELQTDDDDRLWLMVHSGSRGLGPLIRGAHDPDRGGALHGIPADDAAGRAYLADHAWALAFAHHSRLAMIEAAIDGMSEVMRVEPVLGSRVACHHNFVRREAIDGVHLWVHRKGASAAHDDEPGLIPGSMGTATFHTRGRGCTRALCSSSHGAGRAMSRGRARHAIDVRRLHAQLAGIWFDHRLAPRLCEEAPGAYKDIGQVMRAQQELVKIERRVRPLLVYKGV
jgi:tRNA-splicing ligase RtcB